MPLRVCPVAHVRAPVELVWNMLAEPANYGQWWDGRTRSILPEGTAQPGQKIHATSRALGLLWNIDVLVEGVDETRHVLDLMTMLPLGIVLFNHITCRELDHASCQVSFG